MSVWEYHATPVLDRLRAESSVTSSAGPRARDETCDVVVSDVCGYRDQSYDDDGSAGSLARAELAASSGLVMVLFVGVLLALCIRAVRRFWARQLVERG